MTDTKVPPPAGMGRLGIAAAWVSAACCLPYLFLKAVWAVGVPVGVADRSLLAEPGWVAANAVMAVVELLGVLLALALARNWAARLPAWLLLAPVWAGTGLLLSIVLGVALAVGLGGGAAGDGGGTDSAVGGIRPWVFAMVYAGFTGQGVALVVALGSHARARWGRLLGARTGEVLAGRPVRSRPIDLVAPASVAVVVLLVAVSAGYVAVSGESGSAGRTAWECVAEQAGWAAVAAAGVLGLAGRWLRRSRFRLPVALAWTGTGVLVAHPGVFLVLNRVLGSLSGVSVPGWGPVDTVLVVELATGVLVATVSAVLVANAWRAGPDAGSGAG